MGQRLFSKVSPEQGTVQGLSSGDVSRLDSVVSRRGRVFDGVFRGSVGYRAPLQVAGARG